MNNDLKVMKDLTTSFESSVSGHEQVVNIIMKKFMVPVEVVEIIFSYLPITQLELIGATLEQLLYYSKNKSFDCIKRELKVIGGYGITREGKVSITNIDRPK